MFSITHGYNGPQEALANNKLQSLLSSHHHIYIPSQNSAYIYLLPIQYIPAPNSIYTFSQINIYTCSQFNIYLLTNQYIPAFNSIYTFSQINIYLLPIQYIYLLKNQIYTFSQINIYLLPIKYIPAPNSIYLLPIFRILVGAFSCGRSDVLEPGAGDVDAAPDGHARVPVLPDDVPVDTVRGHSQSLADQMSKPGWVEHRPWSDHFIPGKSADFPGDPTHNVTRITNDHQNCIWTEFDERRYNGLQLKQYWLIERLPIDRGAADHLHWFIRSRDVSSPVSTEGQSFYFQRCIYL